MRRTYVPSVSDKGVGQGSAIWRLSFSALFALTLLLGSVFQGLAQTTVTFGTAVTAQTFSGPIYRSSATSTFNGSRFIYLYTQAELAAAGILPGSRISSLAWFKDDVNTMSTGRNGTFQIFLANTQSTAINNALTFSDNIQGAVPVFANATYVPPASSGWQTYAFTANTPFTYTGGSLAVMTTWQINGTGANPTTGAFTWRYESLAGRGAGNGGGTAPLSSTQALATTNNGRPNAQITYVAPLTCPQVAPTITNDTRCGAGSVTLGSTGSDVSWIDATDLTTGGPIESTANNYTIFAGSTTTKYALSKGTGANANVGLATPTSGGGAASAGAFINFHTFDVLNASGIRLNSVDVFPSTLAAIGAALDIEIRRLDGTLIHTASTTVSVNTGTTAQTVPINIWLPRGSYRLGGGAAIPSMMRTIGSTVFPYGIAGEINLTGNSFGTQPNDRWYFYYNWNVSTGCFSAPTAAVATVTAAPTLTLNALDPTTYCETGTVRVKASGYNNYAWSPAPSFVSASGDSVVLNPTATTTYVVLASDTNNCGAQQTITITVNENPNVSIDPIPAALCVGVTQQLQAVGASNKQSRVGALEDPLQSFNLIYGGGTNSTSQRVQYLYLASELAAAGLTAGNITGLGFQVQTASNTASLDNFTVKLAPTSATALTVNFVNSGLTSYHVSNTLPTQGWNDYPFNQGSFAWDGASNILVDVCWSSPVSPGSSFAFTTPTAAVLATYSFGTGCSGLTGTTFNGRTNTRFRGGSVNYSWSPAVDLSATNIANPTVTPSGAGSTVYTVTATDPATGCTETAQVNVNATNVPATPSIAATTATALCGSGTASFLLSGSNGTIDWETSTTGPNSGYASAGVSTTNFTTGTLTQNTWVRAVVSCGGTATSNVIAISVSNPSVTSTVGGVICGQGNIVVSAVTVGNTAWLQGPVGGAQLSTSSSYTFPTTASGTAYAQAYSLNATGSVGPMSGMPGTTAFASSTANYMTFDVLSPQGALINSVHIRPSGPLGTPFTIGIEDNLGNDIGSVSGVTTVAPNTDMLVNLNMFVPAGTNMRMRFFQSPGAYYHQSNVAHPYTIPGVVSITGNDISPAIYAFFYEWSVSSGCFSAITPVNYTVNPAPALTIAPSGSTTFCQGGSVGLTASGTGYVNFSWTPATGLSATNTASVTANPSVTTTYIVTADDGTGPGGCQSADTITVTVNAPPSATATTTAPATVCVNTSSTLEATGVDLAWKQLGFTRDQDSVSTEPYNGGNVSIRSQMLLTQAELAAAGLSGQGFISKLAFEVATKLSTQPYNGFTIRIAQTSLTALTANYENPTFTTVFTGNVSTVTGWNVHNFTTPFLYNGTSNLLIDICFNNNSGSGFDVVYTSNSGFNSFIEAAFLGCNAASGTTSTYRPNIRLDGGAVTYSWSPATDLSNSAIANPTWTPTMAGNATYTVTVTTAAGCTNTASVSRNVSLTPNTPTITADATSLCQSGTVTLVMTGSTGTIAWQSSPDGVNWTLINGETNDTLVQTISATTYFRSVVSCAGSVNSNELEIEVQSPVITSTTDASRCGPGSVTLGAVGTGNGVRYFTQPIGGNPVHVTGSPTWTFPLTSSTSYYVETRGSATTQTAGRAAPADTATRNFTATGLLFDALEDFTLDSLTVYPFGSGNIVLGLYDGSGSLVSQTAPLAVSGNRNAVRIPVKLFVPTGAGYSLELVSATGGVRLIRENNFFSWSVVGGPVDIFGGWNANTFTNAYYYFYNWRTRTFCTSPRVPVVAEVNPLPVAQIVQTGPVRLCGSFTLNAVTDPAFTYQWQLNDVDINGATDSEYVANAPGVYRVVVTASGSCSASSTRFTIHGGGVVQSLPYRERFEGGSAGWQQGGTNSSWRLGTPNKLGLTTAGQGQRAWVTSLTGNYNSAERSFVTSPCFDMTTATNPWLSMLYWSDAEETFDGAVLQVSADGGNTWSTVGALNAPDNGYNSTGGPVWGSANFWSDSSGGWLRTQAALTGLAGSSNARVRIAFESDASINFGGFAFDDVWIADGQPVTTALRTADCGYGEFTKVTGRHYMIADAVAGANRYEFTVTPQPSGTPFVLTGTGTGLDFSANPTLFSYGTTYSVSVRARRDGIWSPVGADCLISFAADPTVNVPTTQVRNSDCNYFDYTLTAGRNYIGADAVAGATDYTFEFEDLNNVGPLAVVTVPFRFLPLADVNNSFPNFIQYGQTYVVRVHARIDMVDGIFGTICQIGIADTTGATATQLRTSDCDFSRTYRTDSGFVLANAVNGASSYTFNVYTNGNSLIGSTTQTGLALDLAPFNLTNATTYKVSVDALVGNSTLIGTDTCSIVTIAINPRLVGANGVSTSLSLYPNPSRGEAVLEGTGLVGYVIEDAAGRQVANAEVTNGRVVVGNGLKAGAYIVRAKLADGSVRTLRMVIAE